MDLPFDGWCDFLSYLAGPGVAAAVGVVVSELAEYVPGYEALTAKMKRVVFAVVCLVVPVVASVVGVQTCGWPFSWSETFWPAIVAGAVAFGAGTLNHMRHMKKKGGGG